MRLVLDADQVQQLLGMLRQARHSRCTAGTGGSAGRQCMLPDAEDAVACKLMAVSTLLSHISGLVPSEAEGGRYRDHRSPAADPDQNMAADSFSAGIREEEEEASLDTPAKKRVGSGDLSLPLRLLERPEEDGGGTHPSLQQQLPSGGRWRVAEGAWRSCALGCLPCAFSPTGRPCILSVPLQPSEEGEAARGQQPSEEGGVACGQQPSARLVGAGGWAAGGSLLHSDGGGDPGAESGLLMTGPQEPAAEAAAGSCVNPGRNQREEGGCWPEAEREGVFVEVEAEEDDYFDRFASQLQGGTDDPGGKAGPGTAAAGPWHASGSRVEMLL